MPGRDEAAGPERWLCAFGFRQTDAALMEAVNVQLARFLGTDEHLALIAPFGFGQDSLPPRLAPEAAPSGL